MTAEMLANNSDEIPEEDNSEETGEEVDDVDGNEEHFVSQEPTQEADPFWNGNPEELPEELQSTYKGMQAAFTKSMQEAAGLKEKYFESIDVANAAMMAQAKAQVPTPQAEAEPQEVVPDLSAGASPEDVIKYYADQAVEKAMDAAGVNTLAQEMQPVAHREKVVGAYRSFAADYPDLDHGKLAPVAGQIIDSDPDLSKLASVNPGAAIRFAARIAQAEMKVVATKQKSRKRRQAAPVSARSGTSVKRKRESMLEAATRALKESGINPDTF
tara:strand:- start:462 stop:1274 length:813 start_codon:yes stop_codon:yes gene_type:complete